MRGVCRAPYTRFSRLWDGADSPRRPWSPRIRLVWIPLCKASMTAEWLLDIPVMDSHIIFLVGEHRLAGRVHNQDCHVSLVTYAPVYQLVVVVRNGTLPNKMILLTLSRATGYAMRLWSEVKGESDARRRRGPEHGNIALEVEGRQVSDKPPMRRRAGRPWSSDKFWQGRHGDKRVPGNVMLFHGCEHLGWVRYQ